VSRRGDCDRCGRTDRKIETHFPDGAVCVSCYSTAVRTRQRCATCQTWRLTPGRDANGQPTCAPCAGIVNRSFSCTRCTTEWALRCGVCEWCYLADQLDERLTGPVELTALRERWLESQRPDSLIIWLYQPHVRALLAGLAAGTIALSHPALDAYPHRRAADHLRAVLVDVGLLAGVDQGLARYDRWIRENLEGHTRHPDDGRLLKLFAAWHLRPHLTRRAAQRPLRASQVDYATQQLRVAGQFLGWLRADHHRTLSTCRQRDLDLWWITPPTTRTTMRTFLVWAIATGHAPRLEVPYRVARDSPLISHQERLDLLRLCLDPDAASPATRAAAMIVLLLAQPFHRIAALPLTAIGRNPAGETTLQVTAGRDPIPIPEPFAALLNDYALNRPALTTATPTSPWLFPGRNAGQHRTAGSIHHAVTVMGINVLGGRLAALRQLVLDCPPTIVAELLDYSYPTTDQHARHAGSPWANYAALKADNNPPPTPPSRFGK